MGTVGIGCELIKKLKEELKKEKNKFKYNTMASFGNIAVYEKLKQMEEIE